MRPWAARTILGLALPILRPNPPLGQTAHSHIHPVRIQSIDGDNHAMLMTCIGGPLHGLQVGIADEALMYDVEGSRPRLRYLRQVPSQYYDPQAGHADSVAFFALSSLNGMEVTNLIIAHLEAFQARAGCVKAGLTASRTSQKAG